MNRRDAGQAVSLAEWLISHGNPQTAVVLGSGLSEVLHDAEAQATFEFSRIPGLPTPTVAGHTGRFVILPGLPAVLVTGRVHAYEGHTRPTVTACVRSLAEAGISNLILTNAAGGIRKGFAPGDLMLIEDHFAASLPATARFLASTFTEGDDTTQRGVARPTSFYLESACWDAQLLQLAADVSCEIPLHRGRYAMMSGPNYETPAEIRWLRAMGADAVGMSTVPEALAAAECGLRTLGVSCITNAAAGLVDAPLDHHEVTETARQVREAFADWLFRLLSRMAAE